MSDQQAVIDFLAAPSTHGGTEVTRVDTHAAAVFLAGQRVLKIKRAVRFPFLDFSTLNKRKAACEAELAVNRPYAPAIYKRVVAITREADGRLTLGGTGEPVEWAVEMARFDETATLDHLAARDVRTLSGGERQRVAIAALLAQDTPLLLLDEPANALDLAHQVRTMSLLSRLCRQSGKTIVMIGHDLNLAHSISTHALLLMGDGRWHAGTVDDALQAPLLSSYLGHPIDAIENKGRRIFIPLEAPHD